MKPGDVAPDFELSDQDGVPRRLSTLLADGPVVLFFYPGAMTTGCTKEACHFRDLAGDFAKAGVQRVGISADEVTKQKSFSDRDNLDYPLLADTDGAVAEQYGVKGGALRRRLGVPVKRVTFAIGTDRRVVEVVASELNFTTHADKALAALTAAQTG